MMYWKMATIDPARAVGSTRPGPPDRTGSLACTSTSRWAAGRRIRPRPGGRWTRGSAASIGSSATIPSTCGTPRPTCCRSSNVLTRGSCPSSSGARWPRCRRRATRTLQSDTPNYLIEQLAWYDREVAAVLFEPARWWIEHADPPGAGDMVGRVPRLGLIRSPVPRSNASRRCRSAPTPTRLRTTPGSSSPAPSVRRTSGVARALGNTREDPRHLPALVLRPRDRPTRARSLSLASRKHEGTKTRKIGAPVLSARGTGRLRSFRVFVLSCFRDEAMGVKITTVH